MNINKRCINPLIKLRVLQYRTGQNKKFKIARREIDNECAVYRIILDFCDLETSVAAIKLNAGEYMIRNYNSANIVHNVLLNMIQKTKLCINQNNIDSFNKLFCESAFKRKKEINNLTNGADIDLDLDKYYKNIEIVVDFRLLANYELPTEKCIFDEPIKLENMADLEILKAHEMLFNRRFAPIGEDFEFEAEFIKMARQHHLKFVSNSDNILWLKMSERDRIIDTLNTTGQNLYKYKSIDDYNAVVAIISKI